MTQHEKILQLLKKRKYKGIHSYERVELGMLQMPVRIKELKERGYDIRTRDSDKNRGVIYYLGEYEPRQDNTLFDVSKYNDRTH